MILQEQPSWNVQDATKIQEYMDCPRKYFYSYVLGWRSDTPNIHLEFGSAWHLAMEHLILHGYEDASVLAAYEKFVDYYRLHFSELTDEIYHPKTPAMALKGLLDYVKEYKGEKFKPLYTEIAGTVTLSERYDLSFKMDSIIETSDGIKSREHKTGSQLSRMWIDQWALKMQTGVYNHVLYCLFPVDEVWGVEINGAIFSKKEVKFQRVPARRTIEGMETWYWNTIDWVEDIYKNFDRLNQCKEEDTILRAFSQNTESCTKYFGCAFHDFCMAWANPLQRCQEVPGGFKIDHWNPKKDEHEAKVIFRINDNEITKEERKVTPI
jgi:hypothetical protein